MPGSYFQWHPWSIATWWTAWTEIPHLPKWCERVREWVSAMTRVPGDEGPERNSHDKSLTSVQLLSEFNLTSAASEISSYFCSLIFSASVLAVSHRITQPVYSRFREHSTMPVVCVIWLPAKLFEFSATGSSSEFYVVLWFFTLWSLRSVSEVSSLLCVPLPFCWPNVLSAATGSVHAR